MQKITTTQRLRYWFDNTMARGTVALIGWLAVLSLIMILIMALVISLLGLAPVEESGQTPGFASLVWANLVHTLDAGTVGGTEGDWPFLAAMLTVTVGGIFIVSTLIGVMSNGINDKLVDLRKGRSRVLEQDHTLILGWSDQVFTILSELIIANASRQRPCIVILADHDKVTMEEEIHAKLGGTGNTRIVCRNGSPIDLTDLEIVNPQGARSIIVLGPREEDPDSHVIKTVLAITHNPRRRPAPYHIVAEIRDARNLEAARLVGRGEAVFVDVGDTVSRVIAQTCRQSGLSVVYTELMDFGGDEIYFQEEPALTGRTYADALLAYETSAIIGLHPKDGPVQLNPPMTTAIQAGDRIIAISEDDSTVKLSGRTDFAIADAAIQRGMPAVPAPERILILGWNGRAPTIINELDHYVATGSVVTVVADAPDVEAEIAARCTDLRQTSVRFLAGDATNRRMLDSLGAGDFDHIIVLCYSDLLDVQRADARTLITLLHLRDMAASSGRDFSIVSEMLDDRNRALAEVTQADDFIVSDKLISLQLAQVSENKYLAAVFADIFDPEGSEIYLKPATDYIRPGQPVNFYTVMEAARRQGHTAIGYRLQALAGDATQAYGVHVNPPKSTPVTFTEADRVIVLADE
ncbi:MAG TPA: potassium transporter TrkA [Chloroflexia bacterium]|nr:potassium transporter TrkA [Chloroflexia bacterium]